MAFTATTLTSPVAVTDKYIYVASATGFAAKSYIRIDDEMLEITNAYVSGLAIPVMRGHVGSVGDAHVVTATVLVGLASDFAQPVQGGPVITYPTQQARTIKSYTTAGAITVPTPGSDAVAILNSTVALAMTLANPAKDNDGDVLTIIGNGKAAHTVTYTAGLGNAGAGYTTLTYDTLGQGCVRLMAANSIWVPWPSPLSNNTSAIDVAVT